MKTILEKVQSNPTLAAKQGRGKGWAPMMSYKIMRSKTYGKWPCHL